MGPESGLSMNGNGVEQLEIIRDPASLQYGSGAIGGVISLAQDEPAPVGKTTGSYQPGLLSNTEGINNRLSLKSANEVAFVGFSGSFDSHADYMPGGSEEEAKEEARNSRYNNLQLQGNGGLTRSWGTTRLSYEYHQQKNGIIENKGEMEGGVPPDEEGEEAEGRGIHRPYHNLVNHSVVSETDWYRNSMHVNATLGLQSNEQQELEEEGEMSGRKSEKEAAMDLTLTTFNYDLNVTQPLSSAFSIITGLNGDIQHNESKGEEAFVPNADISTIGAFAILKWQAGDELTLRGGARFDYSHLKTRLPEEEEAEENGGENDRMFEVPGSDSQFQQRQRLCRVDL